MTIEFEETIADERLQQGTLLHRILNDLEPERKNAIIGFRCVNTDIPQSVDNEDLQWVNFKSSIDTLAAMGICYISEDDLQELLADFKERVGEVYSDHRAWSVLTVLEVDAQRSADESYYEANLYDGGSKLNPEPIDLVCESDELEFVTCKFDISTQQEAAKDKGAELNRLSSDIDHSCVVCLGTLNPKVKERLENQFGELFDEIVSGVDILTFN